MSTIIKVLINEHDPNDLELLLYELKKSGINYASCVVQSEADFRDALTNFDPDIILSDYSLPSFDGLTAFEIKERVKPDTPFIFVSGTIGEESAVELIKKGVTDYALKDKLFTLNPKITRALNDKAAIRTKRIADERLKTQNEKLFEIAFLQSHQVRGPIASVLGLISLFKHDDLCDPINGQIINMLQTTTVEFDKVIHDIVRKTSELEAIR